jgi:hypothetical protein
MYIVHCFSNWYVSFYEVLKLVKYGEVDYVVSGFGTGNVHQLMTKGHQFNPGRGQFLFSAITFCRDRGTYPITRGAKRAGVRV